MTAATIFSSIPETLSSRVIAIFTRRTMSVKIIAALLVIGLMSASGVYATSSPEEQNAPASAETASVAPPAGEPAPQPPAQNEPAPQPAVENEPAPQPAVENEPAPQQPAAIEPAPSVSTSPVSPSSGHAEITKRNSGDDYVTLNFTNIDIKALIKVMSELTRRNFILDERVAGKITIMTPTKMSPDEAYQVFLSALEIKGFTAVEDGTVTRIVPAATARQSGLKVLQDGESLGEGFVTKLIRMKYVNPQDIVHAITPLISKDGNLIAYPYSNSIIITDSVYNIRKIESLVRAMDVAAPEGRGKINVYNLKNANAEEIAKLLSALVARLPVAQMGGAAKQYNTTTILEGAVNITADKSTNSLIIVALPSDLELVKDVIQKLDVRRRQVYVETAIIEMSLAKQRELGFEFQAANLDQLEGSSATVGIGGTNFGTIGSAMINGPAALASTTGLAVAAVKGTFTFKGTEYLNIGALLHAVQNDADVNVLSTPNILTTDNQKAEIMVGQNVPFKTAQTQNAATGGAALLNTYERKDVGIKLSLTPQITSDDNVRLEVNQEISDVIETSISNDAGPITSKRSASTTVVVKDRETMVIGGLIRDNVTSSTMKVPFLGDIPVLGWLFKYKTNLMIFITPHIIKTAEESAELTRQREGILNDFRKQYHLEKKSEGSRINLKQADSRGRAEAAELSAGNGVAGAAVSSPTTTPAAEAVKSGPTTTASVPEEKAAVPAGGAR
jgi:general secretion pathway protein D